MELEPWKNWGNNTTIAKKQLLGKKRGCPTERKTKKMRKIDKKDVIEVDKYDERKDDTVKIKWIFSNALSNCYLRQDG